jgi:hypothetical protein
MKTAVSLMLVLLVGACASPPRQLVYVDESAMRGQYGHYVRALLLDGAFDRLEALADSLQRTDARWPSGRAYAESYYERGFAEVDDPKNPAQWHMLLDRLREWTDTHEESYVARYSLAEALVGRAWAARGQDWASHVSPSQWDRFNDDLDEARALLGQMPARAQDSYEWRMLMLRVLHGTREDALYRDLAQSTVRRFPAEQRLYSNVALHLMPRWYGSEGEWQRFANDATAALPDSLSDEFYARTVTSQGRYMEQNPFRDRLLSWPRVKHGLLLWHERWPSSTQPLSAGAQLGALAEDRDFTRACFASLADTFDVEIWWWLPPYQKAREWAEQPAVETSAHAAR